MRISDWSSDVCSSDLAQLLVGQEGARDDLLLVLGGAGGSGKGEDDQGHDGDCPGGELSHRVVSPLPLCISIRDPPPRPSRILRRESELEADLRRSEERRVGKECVSTGRYRWAR